MTDDQLRALVKDAIQRHLGGAPAPVEKPRPDPPWRAHASFAKFLLPAGDEAAGGDGLCLIEPSVRCNHCGYCQSYGH
jgi:hypothetical protein